MAKVADASAFGREKSLNVIILGGSLAGLLYGVMFKRLGHNVHLLEQTDSSRRANQAAGIGIGPRGSEFFKIYDQCKEQFAFSCPGFQMLNRDGTVKRLTGPSLRLTSWDVLYHRLRANFDGLRSPHYPESPSISENDGRTIYDLGKRAVAVTYDKSALEVHYEDVTTGLHDSLDADLVIVADGSHSIVRRSLLPETKDTYAGYVTWRGVVPERDISYETRDLLDERFNMFVMKRGYIVGYAMPGENGTLVKGERYLNWLWYYNCPGDSKEFTEIMTDTDGHLRTSTMPAGKIRPEVWMKLKSTASELLNPPFLELVNKTANPFISTIRDLAAPRAAFCDGRLLLVGEALTVYRPHTGVGFNQSALDCLRLCKVLQKEKTTDQWEGEILWTRNTTRLFSIVYGEYYQSGMFSARFALNLGRFLLAMVLSRLVSVFRRLST